MPNGSHANTLPQRARDVARIYYDANCPQQCQHGVSVNRYESRDYVRLPSHIVLNLNKLAFSQAQIWGDTILEGDFTADGRTQLDSIMVIYQQGRVIGYAITYSEKAWYTGKCAYIPRNFASLASCQEGRIVEQSFVTANMDDIARDENQFADFHAKE